MSALLLVVAGLVCCGGFACLALAMPRHWAEASRQRVPVPGRPGLRRRAFLMLGVAYALLVYRDGPSFGSVLWVMLLSASAVVVALILAWRPQVLLPVVGFSFLRRRANKGSRSSAAAETKHAHHK